MDNLIKRQWKRQRDREYLQLFPIHYLMKVPKFNFRDHVSMSRVLHYFSIRDAGREQKEAGPSLMGARGVLFTPDCNH